MGVTTCIVVAEDTCSGVQDYAVKGEDHCTCKGLRDKYMRQTKMIKDLNPCQTKYKTEQGTESRTDE